MRESKSRLAHMGYFERGLPTYWLSFFKKLSSPRVFVETGTFEGETVMSMVGHFDELHSIEASNTYFEISRNKLSTTEIFLHHGESPNILRNLLPKLNNLYCVFFLDAHFSSGDTFGDYVEQPLMQELSIIIKNRNFTNTLILIDDARLLNGFLGYPSISDIHKLLDFEDVQSVIIDDILIIGSNSTLNVLGNPNDFGIQLTSEPVWY